MTARGLAGLCLGGTLAFAGWGAAGLGMLNPSHVAKTAAPSVERSPMPPAPAAVTAAPPVPAATAIASSPPEPVLAPAGPSAAAAPAVEPTSTDAGPKPPPATGMQLAAAPASDPARDGPKPPPETDMQLASVPPTDPVDAGAKPPVRAIEPAHECDTDTCIDAYLWSLYERTPKIDTVKAPQQTKVTVKKNGKTRTVTHTVMTYVVDDFTAKDPAAAQRAGRSLTDFVIGGMDHGFKVKLYRALRAMDDAGLMPGITSAFRDDYRQSIATGNKAASDSSFHGGSRRGGYGHGLAADLVSVKGDTRMQRYAASEVLWAWIDAHEKELGIGRPYRDRDPPHVGPIDGTEYIVKRALANMHKRAAPKTADKPQSKTKTADKPQVKTTGQVAAHTDAGATKHASPAKLSKQPAKTAHPPTATTRRAT